MNTFSTGVNHRFIILATDINEALELAATSVALRNKTLIVVPTPLDLSTDFQPGVYLKTARGWLYLFKNRFT